MSFYSVLYSDYKRNCKRTSRGAPPDNYQGKRLDSGGNLASVAPAVAPQLVNYQGKLLDSGGNPVTTTTTVIFAVWNALTAGDSLWSESQSVTPDADGLFSVLLGSVSPIPDSAFAGSDTYLGIKVGADPEITPRQRLASVPYAFRVNSVDGATGGIISGDVSIQSDLFVSGKATIGPGHTNTGTNAFVAGKNNTASGSRSTVGGGYLNTANASFATVGGGYLNEASLNLATVSGGQLNSASGEISAVGGGSHNTASDWYSTVGGGMENTAGGWASTVGGGLDDTASGPYATVGGGRSNIASKRYATVGGGRGNMAIDTFTTVSGGDSNTASGHYATVSGGDSNTASGHYATVGGGRDNHADTTYATVGGGWANTASGNNATIPGGLQNEASGNYSFAAGRRAHALHNGSFVWGDQANADISSTGINQFLVRSTGGATIYTNAALTAGVTLGAGGSSWSPVSDSTLKENIRPVDGSSILSKLSELDISRWNYKSQDPSIEHIGPMAQDFYRLFGLGEDDKHINTVDPDGVALTAIKALYDRVKALESENAELKAELKGNDQRLGQLESMVEKILANQDNGSDKLASNK